MAAAGIASQVHRKKPKGKAMSKVTSSANNRKSKIRSKVEHVFAEQKYRMGLFIRTIGIERARVKIGLANIVYSIKRLMFLERSEEHTSELQSLMRISYAVFCLKKKNNNNHRISTRTHSNTKQTQTK